MCLLPRLKVTKEHTKQKTIYIMQWTASFWHWML